MPILKLPETVIYFEQEGKGPPILFLHGIGVVGGAWKPQTEVLKNRFSTLIMDNRGIGRSLPCNGPIQVEAMGKDAAALLEHLGWESAHVVGHSLGGVIAQELALQFPKRVRSLSLLCTFASGRAGARPTPWVVWMSMRTHVGTRDMRRRAFLEMLLTKDEIAKRGTQELNAEIMPLVGRDLGDNPSIMMKQLRALGRHHALPRLGELKSTPTLVISAELDPIAGTQHGRQLHTAIPCSRFEILRGSSHGVVLTQANEVNSRLHEFIASVERDRIQTP